MSDERGAVHQLETAVRRAIAEGIPTHEVAEIVRDLTGVYDRQEDPQAAAREDLALSY